jgi:predicted amidohydrolase
VPSENEVVAELQTIAAVQMNVDISDKESNLRRMLFFLEQTAGEGAKLTVFPECALTGYCFDSLDEALPLAEPIPGQSTEIMASACKRLNCHVVYGLLEADGKRVFNAAVLVGPKGVVGSYRKVHLPFLGIDRFTTPGDRPFAVHNAGGIRVGMNICYDGSFPEAARVMTLDGADLIVLPTNWPPGSECMASCAVNTRAMENQIYYLACNRVGTERGFRFIGTSKICAPGGSTIAEALHENEAILYASVDVDKARNKHLVRVPKLHEIDRIKDRRPEMYGRLVEPK